jgi:hypothetical protein
MRPLLLTVALALAACQPEPEVLGPEDYDVSGNWHQSGDFADAVTGESHIHVGRFTWTQTGGQFAGDGEQEGFCSTATGSQYQGPLADETPFDVTDGVVTGLSVRFQAGVCAYEGSFEGGNPDRMTGTAVCRYDLAGTAYTFRGRWQADRLSR